ncbi:MAG: aminotransferase class V-fold PLP-dependent enzyme, partial [Candidatus Gastranaerophilales bacterium]|nr:aminotransferase class V-fold PLP-dependent enzyme [Candidatus Gastranaerophilales bacterium]
MEKIIYVDNNATTQVDPEVINVMLPYFGEKYGNPSSIHAFGGQISKDIEHARELVADLVGASNPREIIFTGSGSESANMAIKGTLLNTQHKHLITTKVEHACVMNTYKWLEKRGYHITYIGVNSEGEIDLEELKQSIAENTALV